MTEAQERPETPDLNSAHWFKSTASQSDQGCVEVAFLVGHVALRDSKDPNGPALLFTDHEWSCFLDGTTKGEFHRT